MLAHAALAIAILVLLWSAVVAGLLLWYRRTLSALWREPVWRRPVLVIESDDWGAGPLLQAEALAQLAQRLRAHRDGAGKHPVLNLALVLAVPDGPGVRASGEYRRIELDHPRFAPILGALRFGQAQGVFALQLHGLEHYWPPTLMACADPAVQAWLRQDEPATTEQLPSPLQSRWVDAHRLPTVPLPEGPLHAAVADEVNVYTRIVGAAPQVVVPPTFVWTRECERAWAEQGIGTVVTPGWRYIGRGADGLPCGDEGPIVNGDRRDAVTYLSRSDYFEPARGRDALYALGALERATRQGQPCLLENHRDNFIGDPTTCQRSLDELDLLYREALARHPHLRFLSSHDVAGILVRCDQAWLCSGWREGLTARWHRLQGAGRLWRLMRLTGLATAGHWALRALAA